MVVGEGVRGLGIRVLNGKDEFGSELRTYAACPVGAVGGGVVGRTRIRRGGGRR